MIKRILVIAVLLLFPCLAGAQTYTNDPIVNLELTANDTGCGIVKMRFSNDGGNWSDWENFILLKENWALSPGDGLKKVWAQFMDCAGNIGIIGPDEITLVTTNPTGTIKIIATNGDTGVTLTIDVTVEGE